MTSKNLRIKLKTSPGRTITLPNFIYSLKHASACSCFFKVKDPHLSSLESPKNVVVVHCNAGKGRTGTMIACFLIFSGLCSNAKDAINYYGWKRFRHGKGVT